MSNIIPPLFSSTPPPMSTNNEEEEEDDDDEFGDFTSGSLSFRITDVSKESDDPSWKNDSLIETNCFHKNLLNDSAHDGHNINKPAVFCTDSAVTDDEDEGFKTGGGSHDTTSQDSVVSGATDSGLCSASHHSGGMSQGEEASHEESSGSDETIVRNVSLDVRTITDSDESEIKSCENSDCTCTDIRTGVTSHSHNTCRIHQDDASSSSVFKSTYEGSQVQDFIDDSMFIDKRNLGDDEFDDYSSYVEQSKNEEDSGASVNFPTHLSDDQGFNDKGSEFADFQAANSSIVCEPTESQDDFSEFSAAEVSPNETGNKQSLEEVVSLLFPQSQYCPNQEQELCDTVLPIDFMLEASDNTVWKNMKDIDNTHSLSFQWSTSESYKSFLKMLGLHTGIAFGSKWNSSVPRFAANLGFSPLEPVRAIASSSSSSTNTLTVASPVTESEGVVPAAEFDWNSSGLVNPLDCLEKTVNVPQKIPSVHPDNLLVSDEARRIADTLPDLTYLRARILMFPIHIDSSRAYSGPN